MKKIFFFWFFLSSFFVSAHASVLKLADALSRGLEHTPAITKQKLAEKKLQLDKQLLHDDLSSRLYFRTRLQWIQPLEISYSQQTDDHAFSLFFSKKLYDFGLSNALIKENELDQTVLSLKNTIERKNLRLKIIQAYFDVLLSDLRFKVWNEAMSIAYIAMDRARDRMELKEITDIDYLEKQQQYQEVFLKRTEAEQQQRLSRSKLASVLALDELPEDVEDIIKVDWNKKIPDFEKLLQEIEKHNVDLQLLNKEIALLKQKQHSNQKTYAPELNFEASVSQFSKVTPGSYPAYVRFSLNYPLYEGTSEELKNEQIQLEINQRLQDIRTTKDLLRDQLLALWQKLNLLVLKKKKADINTEYRDYYLDRSRALYELELKSDLGDAMTEYTSAILEQAEVRYEWLLTWEALSLLTEQKALSLIEERGK